MDSYFHIPSQRFNQEQIAGLQFTVLFIRILMYLILESKVVKDIREIEQKAQIHSLNQN